MGTPRKDLAGQRFGSLTVLREGEPHVFPRGAAERTCLMCGAKFEGYPRTRYCPDCKAKEKLLKNASKPVKSGKALRKCKSCGKDFWADAGSDVYLCPECAKNARSGSVLRTRVCQMCGAEFDGYPRSKYCPECRKIAKAEASRQSKHRQKAGTTRAIGSVDVCQNCGKPYTVTGGLQKYCPDCAEKVTRENIQAHKRAYNADHAEQLTAHKAEMRSNRRVCVVCGKTFDSSTRTITCSPECAKIRAEQMRKRNRQKKKEKENAENN